MAGQFDDDDGRERSAHRLTTAASVQWGAARGLIPSLAAARRGQRTPTVLSGSVEVVSLSTPTRLRLSDVVAAVTAETHAVDCAEGRVDAAFARLGAATQRLDRRWWGTTR